MFTGPASKNFQVFWAPLMRLTRRHRCLGLIKAKVRNSIDTLKPWYHSEGRKSCLFFLVVYIFTYIYIEITWVLFVCFLIIKDVEKTADMCSYVLINGPAAIDPLWCWGWNQYFTRHLQTWLPTKVDICWYWSSGMEEIQGHWFPSLMLFI